MTTDIVIPSAARMPVGSFNGAFANTPAHDLGTVAIKAALNRAKVAAEEVDEVILGQSHLDVWQGPTNRHGP
jgi:acetyl-CoA C-acetyltransferase